MCPATSPWPLAAQHPSIGWTRRHAAQAGASAALVVAAGSARAQPAGIGFTIGTDSLGSATYAIGGRLAEVLSRPPGTPACKADGPCGVKDLFAIAQTSPGPVASVLSLGAKDVDSALCQADVAFAAFQGRAMFAQRGAMTDLRAIAALHDELLQIVIRPQPAADGDRVLRLMTDTAFSGATMMAETLMEVNPGMAATELVEATIDRALDRLERAEIDGFVVVRGVPSRAVAEAVTRLDAGLVDLDEPVRDDLVATNPFLFKADIEADTYPHVEARRTIGVRALWLVRETAPNNLITAVLEALWHPANLATLQAVHPAAERIALDRALSGISVPLHDAALAFYSRPSDGADDGATAPLEGG